MDAVRRVSAYLAAHADEPVTLARARPRGLDEPAPPAAPLQGHRRRLAARVPGGLPRGSAACQPAPRQRCHDGHLRGGLWIAQPRLRERRGARDEPVRLPPPRRRHADRLFDRVQPVRTAARGHDREWRVRGEAGRLGRVRSAASCARSTARRRSAKASRRRADWVQAIVAHLEGELPALDLPIDVQATAFQWKVWRALQAIPYGQTRPYADVARSIGQPRAVRAVARACATNPVALVVPCHRVVADRRRARRLPLGHPARKARLLEKEGARHAEESARQKAEGRGKRRKCRPAHPSTRPAM